MRVITAVRPFSARVGAGRASPASRAIAAVILVLASALGPTQARADASQILQIFNWPRWQKGLSLGIRALGKFGKGTSMNAPPGDWLIEADYHVWFRHLFEAHVVAGYGLSNSTMTYGLGVKLNLIEYLRDPTGKTRAEGIQRGLASGMVQDFMLYASVDFRHYSFKDPTPPAVYETGTWAIQPALGAQFYFNIRTEWARRFYFALEAGYATLNDNKFLVPYAGFGVELR
jgi:hypothetical protein